VISGRRAAGWAAGISLSWGLVAAPVLIGPTFATPSGANPFFYFGLCFFGGAAFSVLLGGIGALFARDRTPVLPALDIEFFAGIRRLMLAMSCRTVVMDALGLLLLPRTARGVGDTTPVGTGIVVVALVVAATTATCAALSAIVLRRHIPRGFVPFRPIPRR